MLLNRPLWETLPYSTCWCAYNYENRYDHEHMHWGEEHESPLQYGTEAYRVGQHDTDSTLRAYPRPYAQCDIYQNILSFVSYTWILQREAFSRQMSKSTKGQLSNCTLVKL